MKGLAPIAIAAIVIVAVIVMWGTGIYFFVGEHEAVVRSVREREILKLINEMEWIKRVVPQALKYSFYQSSYFLAGRGGYFDPNTVPSYNCIPYWRIYDKTYFPAVEENLNKTLIKYLNEYASALGIALPDYEISYKQDDGTTVDLKSAYRLELGSGIAEVEDEADFTENFDIKIFQIFEKGKNKFIDEDAVLSAINDALGALCEELKDKIAAELKKPEIDGISIEVEDIQADCKGHVAVKVLVKITDTGRYPVYDYKENTTSLRNVQLKFYVITGNANLIEAETTICES